MYNCTVTSVVRNQFEMSVLKKVKSVVNKGKITLMDISISIVYTIHTYCTHFKLVSN